MVFIVLVYFRYLNENELAIENEKKQLILKKEFRYLELGDTSITTNLSSTGG